MVILKKGWEEFCKKAASEKLTLEELKREAETGFDAYQVYPESINVLEGCLLFLARTDEGKKLVVMKDGPSRLLRISPAIP